MSFIYKKEDFCIPVTKACSRSEVEFIVKDFISKKVTFCLGGDEEETEIWRQAGDRDLDCIKKKGSPENPVAVYLEGVKQEDYTIG